MREKRERLESLDVLRGADLFLLVFLQPVLWAVCPAVDWPWYHDMMWHFEHAAWEGFRAWDMIMPLFLFMVGTSMPFALARFRGNPRGAWARILRRFLLLFLFGMIVQGNLLALDADRLYIYNNTLQAIAFGYVIAAVTLLNTGVRGQILTTVALLLIYWLPMRLFGDYTPTGNFAFKVDELIIGRFRGDLTYTWVWSSLTFGATVLLGALAGQMMKNPRATKTRTAGLLALVGAALVGLGLLWDLEHPIIKHLWTSSMTLFAAGICYLLMAVFYWWIDCRGHRRGLQWLKVYGLNSITAYVLGEVVDFRSIVASVSYGLQNFLSPEWYGAWLTFGNFAILYLILLWMQRDKIYLKL